MTDKEIIQALRCCEKEVCADGGLCPLFSDADCIVHLGEAAIDLIERLTAENVALREGASLGKVKRSQKQAYEKQIESLQALANRQLSEIKKLQKDLCWKDLEVDAAEWKQERAEAERDAAIADLKISSGCASCKYHCSDPIFCRDCNKKQNCKCMSCSLGLTNWKWHGLPEAPEGGMMKGASNFDKLCHQVYNADGNNRDYIGKATGVTCRLCKSPLYAYYCEERLYLVECKTCKMKALVMAENPQAAAYRAFGIEVK